MKISGSTILLLAVLALSFSCKKKPQAGYRLVKAGEPFELKLNESAKLDGEDLKVTFTKVLEDSRCPEGTDCFWAGEVKIAIAANTGNRSYQIALTREGKQTGPVTLPAGNFRISLLEVAPYPKNQKKIPPEDYRIKLSVRRK